MPSYREKGIIEGAAEDAGWTLQMLFEAVGWMRSAPRKLREIRDLTAESVFSSMPVIFIIAAPPETILSRPKRQQASACPVWKM